MQLSVKDLNGGASATSLDVLDGVFNAEFKEGLIHQVVVSYMAQGRAGTKAQKSRSEVRGGGRKPWRQKGTGRARAGTKNSPIWRGGGATFAAKPRDYSSKVNRKMYRAAMRSMLSELARQERLHVVDQLAIEDAKTKLLLAQLNTLNLTDVLIVLEGEDLKVDLAARNLPSVDVCIASKLSPLSLVSYDSILITAPALRSLEESLK